MSTILGTIIFIGILFSAVIPMQLVMKQADTLYTQLLHEVNQADEDRLNEDLLMYAYPIEESSNELRIKVVNKCEIPITLTRFWIKDNYTEINNSVNVGGSATLGPYAVELVENTSYPIKVVTERGNVVRSASDSLYYADGIWYTPSLGISINIANDKGKYYIRVSNTTWYAEYNTQGQDFGDLIKYFEVAEPGYYNVVTRKSTGGGWLNLPGTPMTIEIKWPDGTPIVYVYTSGLDL